MTNAFIPEGSRPTSWILPDWWDNALDTKNPVEIYTWDLPNPDNPDEIIAYEMQEWELKMYVSIAAKWDDPPRAWVAPIDCEYGDQRYQDTEIWIELDVSPIFLGSFNINLDGIF